MAGVVFGCIVPHPPLLVPDVGRGQEREIIATTRAMEKLSQGLGAHRPETMLVVSPHGLSHHGAMGVLTAPSSSGNLRRWGERGPDYYFDNDPDLVAAIKEAARGLSIPLSSIGEHAYELDHGVLVPMHFLIEGVKDVPMVPLTFCWLPLSIHFAFGQAIRRAADDVGKRVALIASGDLSHRLLPGAPAGYDRMGKVFDEKLVAALARLDVEEILKLDQELIDRAGECGLRSIVILLGALDGLSVEAEVLSYEGPFGVGYLVASFSVTRGESEKGESKEMHPLVRLARETVEGYVRKGSIPRPEELTPEMKGKAGVFVSLKKHGELRGCIGTFEPTRPNIAEETITNAVSSATRDPRFPPVTPQELGELEYSVDVLSLPEPVEGRDKLDPRRYGVIVERGWQRGLLLPDLEGVDSAEQQVEICRLKAGIAPDEAVKLYRFEVKRYK
jgi:AmmeMemoRadiSam system protein A